MEDVRRCLIADLRAKLRESNGKAIHSPRALRMCRDACITGMTSTTSQKIEVG